MPENACLFFYDCPNCFKQLKPKEGDCCVFCSYSNAQCLPKQFGISLSDSNRSRELNDLTKYEAR